MIENLPISIFWVLLSVFVAMVAAGIIFRNTAAGGIFLFMSGVWLVMMFIPVTSVDAYVVDYTNVTSDNVVGNETITEDIVYEPAIEIDYTMKAFVVFFGALLCLFGWWIGDFNNVFDSV